MLDDVRDERARSRSSWPVRRFRLGAEPPGTLRATTTAEERLAMMWPLALEAWSLTGRPLPDYSRASAPVERTTMARLAAGEPAT